MTKSYRIYFRNERGAIIACENFPAPGDEAALAIAARLFDACSDCCAQSDVWCGKERIDAAARPSSGAMPLTIRMQTALLRAAEALGASGSKIAASARLPALIAQLQGPRASRPRFVQFWRMIAEG
jgi:hypothetical protein